ncbi:MAG: murein transglycosylase [Ponticaulis sp.]|nr:murein transglycosylase [Ponticaulis sp.]
MAPIRRFRGLIFGLALLAGCEPKRPEPPPTPVDPPSAERDKPEPTAFTLEPLAFSDLEDWETASIEPAFSAFSRSCSKLFNRDPDSLLSERAPYGGQVKDWLPACRILPKYQHASEFKRFFEDYFVPNRILTNQNINKLTGYYEPELQAAYKPTGTLTAAIPTRPDDLIEVRLGDFEESLGNRRLWGKVDGNQLVLYPPRAEIETAPGKAIGFADPADVFFLQIQGSGRVRFPDGKSVRAGFSAHNHRPFGSLANHLLETGEITRAEAGMTGLRAWLARVGTDRARAAMNVNPRFIWFRETPIEDPSLGPEGAAGIPLTPMGSVAIDLDQHPLGVPIMVRTRLPERPGKSQDDTSSLLLVAQDTGGAIKGAQRGDIFFGWGDEAGGLAGSMNLPGQFFVFLPQKIEAEPEISE